MNRHDRDDSDCSFMDRIWEVLRPGSRRYVIAGAILFWLLFLTRGAITLPLVVGWSDARQLLERERQRDALKRELDEYHRAIPHFRSPEGQQQARRMFYKYREEGEVSIRPTPQAPGDGLAERLNGWMDATKNEARDWSLDRSEVLKRWAMDPPEEENAEEGVSGATSAPAVEDLAREAFEANDAAKTGAD
ncbi:MAG: hypothetical protein HPY44_06120 [Armatimonadetes bacterium]|nr:hypothetical protein [Armatimonadota bacterium]